MAVLPDYRCALRVDDELIDISRVIELRKYLDPGDPIWRVIFGPAQVTAAQHQPLGGRSVGSRSWSRSGARAKENIRSRARPEGSWSVALDRARREWDELAGGPPLDLMTGAGARRYSEQAAAAILALAVALWPQVAAELAATDDPDGV